jgi:hypothetical protein
VDSHTEAKLLWAREMARSKRAFEETLTLVDDRVARIDPCSLALERSLPSRTCCSKAQPNWSDVIAATGKR